MLVLGRKPGEYVVIGENIMVKVVRGSDGGLRLAIDAPEYINVIRGEIYETRLQYASEKEIGPNVSLRTHPGI